MQLLPPLLPLQLARPFLLAFEWATRHPPLLLHNLPTLGIGDIKWAGTAGNCSVQNQPVARQRKWGTGTDHVNEHRATHPPCWSCTQICTSSPVHLTPSWCTNVQGGHHADQIWCTTCTEPHTRKQTSSSIDSDYHPCLPAHQRFFVALGRSPKAAHRKYEYTVGSCYETVRLFTHGGHLPRLPHWPDNRQCR